MSLFRRRPVSEERLAVIRQAFSEWLDEHEVDRNDPEAVRATLPAFVVAKLVTRREAEAWFRPS